MHMLKRLGQFFYHHVFLIIIFESLKDMTDNASKLKRRNNIISHKLNKQKAIDPACQKFHAKYDFWTTSLLLVAFPLADINFIDVSQSLTLQ